MINTSTNQAITGGRPYGHELLFTRAMSYFRLQLVPGASFKLFSLHRFEQSENDCATCEKEKARWATAPEIRGHLHGQLCLPVLPLCSPRPLSPFDLPTFNFDCIFPQGHYNLSAVDYLHIPPLLATNIFPSRYLMMTSSLDWTHLILVWFLIYRLVMNPCGWFWFRFMNWLV